MMFASLPKNSQVSGDLIEDEIENMFFGVSQEEVLVTQKWKNIFSGVILTFYSYPKVRIKVRVRIKSSS
jgi:hypothetical protein